MKQPNQFLTLNEVAERYRVTYVTAHNWAVNRHIPAFKLGGPGRGTWRVPLAGLERIEASAQDEADASTTPGDDRPQKSARGSE